MRNESLKINFYCDEKYQNRVPEPIESSKSFPEWFSELPLVPKKYATNGNDVYSLRVDESHMNVKKCLGIQDFLKTGYLIPAWADFVFREDENGSLYVNWVENLYDDTNYNAHGESQYYTMPNKPIYGHFGKVNTPWIVKTDPGVSCLITHPVWHNNKSFTSATAVFHTDVSPLNIPWFFEWNYKIETKMDVENLDVKSMGFNSTNYIHNLYQVMNLAFADRDFYYGDPYFDPEEPVEGLLSKDYAKERLKLISDKNNKEIKPGNPYDFQKGKNPFLNYIDSWETDNNLDKIKSAFDLNHNMSDNYDFEESFMAGTTTVQAADTSGWIVSITPSGGWIPAVIAGNTGIGLSQRMQSFVLDPKDGPYNVLEPGKRPRATLTPTIALKNNEPYLSFAVQGGDSQDQNLLQFFLNMVEFDMNVQEATEAPNINSFQMRSSFGYHENRPGDLLLHDSTPSFIRKELRKKGYKLQFRSKTSGPINAIFFDNINKTFQGGSSDFGEDYGIAW